MTSPACPAGPQLIGQSKQVIAGMPGVGDVEVKIVMIPPWTPDRMTEDARDQLGIFFRATPVVKRPARNRKRTLAWVGNSCRRLFSDVARIALRISDGRRAVGRS